ncbi:MAG: acyl carrier protein [Candidatus Dechloromonas phosphoritropha]|jgi:acyl carrier protein|nr:acyl carrier protein [Candidatus Dechloromonas phosphoritropha]MBP8788328.1 acyl carrier protein [Azonexus sp.]MBP9228930.1 acyl carrier protein [Azonexus sp.]
MPLNKESIEAEIKARIVEIAAEMGDDASELGVDEIIPATGLIDSTGLLELIAWYEKTYQIPLAQEEINIDNLGTLARMAEFVLRKKGLL